MLPQIRYPERCRAAAKKAAARGESLQKPKPDHLDSSNAAKPSTVARRSG
jgi:hypothetical protein